jgi:FtsZ-binding cell division protein ZapB
MSISEKVAYLKGLAEGLGLDTENKEGKLILAIIDTLSLMAVEIDELGENALDIGEELDALSDDIADIEEMLFDEDDDDDFDDFDDFDDEDDDCAHCPHGHDFSINVECQCGEVVELDEDDIAHGSVTCPACGEELFFDFDDEDDDDDDDDDDEDDDDKD